MNFIYIARGSTGEVRSITHVLELLPEMNAHHVYIVETRSRAASIARQLRGWADNLQNSNIKGQRHLNDGVKREVAQKKEWAEFDAEMKHYPQNARLSYVLRSVARKPVTRRKIEISSLRFQILNLRCGV